MKSAPRPARTQSRTEKPRARCLSTYLKAAAAEPATERIEPNMRAFSGSRNGCAGDPATSGRSSTLGATVSSRHSSPLSRLLTVAPSVELRSEEHTSELQSHSDLVCRLLLEKKKITVDI